VIAVIRTCEPGGDVQKCGSQTAVADAFGVHALLISRPVVTRPDQGARENRQRSLPIDYASIPGSTQSQLQAGSLPYLALSHSTVAFPPGGGKVRQIFAAPDEKE